MRERQSLAIVQEIVLVGYHPLGGAMEVQPGKYLRVRVGVLPFHFVIPQQILQLEQVVP
jgi:hypothetical protein